MPNGARHWAFTLNNYQDGDIDKLERVAATEQVIYIIFGKETSSTGTPHLQGHVHFSSQRSLRQAKTLIDVAAHLTLARNIQRSIDYCKKEGDYRELGTPPQIRSKAGQRSDLEAFRDSVKNGVTDMSVLREAHPCVMARYPRFALSVIRDLRPKLPVATHPLHSWQSSLVEKLSVDANARSVIFLVDTKGNAGKTYFADYVEATLPKVQVMKPGKCADMAFEYSEDTLILIIDVPRSKMNQFEYMYSFIECIKDGRLFSPKYEPITKRFPPPHVLVMMNEEPDYSALSEDRYDVIDVENST